MKSVSDPFDSEDIELDDVVKTLEELVSRGLVERIDSEDGPRYKLGNVRLISENLLDDDA